MLWLRLSSMAMAVFFAVAILYTPSALAERIKYEETELDCTIKEGYAEVEYEDDRWTDNVWLWFNHTSGVWQWKWPGHEGYGSYRPVYRDTGAGNVGDVNPHIIKALRDKNYLQGMSILEDVLNRDTYQGINTGDDYVKLHYPDNGELTLDTDYYPVYCLFDKAPDPAKLDSIEYEDDTGQYNIYYAFSNGEWKWKSQHTGNSLRSLSAFRGTFQTEHHSDIAYLYLRDELMKVNSGTGTAKERYWSGLKVFENALLKEGDFSDDYLYIHYTDGTRYPDAGTEHLDVICLKDLAGYSTGVPVCKVYNVELPEKTEPERSWIQVQIASYGAPEWVFYYQNFPHDQNTWGFVVDWKVYGIITLLSAIPIFKPIKGVAAAGRAVRAVVAKRLAKEALTKIVAKRLLRGAVVRGVAYGIEAYAAAVVESYLSMLEAKPNQVLLVERATQPMNIKRIDNLDKKPVLVYWDSCTACVEHVRTFHLVSPCYIDHFEVPQAFLPYCDDFYIYNSNTGAVTCEDAEIYTWGNTTVLQPVLGDEANWEYMYDYPTCALSFRGVSQYFLELDDPRMDTDPIQVLKEMNTSDVIKYIRGSPNIDDIEFYKITPAEIDVSEGSEEGEWLSMTDITPVEYDMIYRIKFDYGEKEQVLIDSDYNGKLDSYHITACIVPGIIATNILKMQKGTHNYCLDQRLGYEGVLEWIGFGVGMAGLIVAGFLTFGKGWIIAAAWASIVVGTAVELGAQIEEWEGSWPGETDYGLDISPKGLD